MYARLKVSIYIIMCVLDHHYCTHYTLPLHKLYRIICMSCDNIYVFFPKNWCCCSHCSSFDRFVCVSLRWCFLFARWLTPIGDMRDLNASCRRYYCYCQFSPCWRLFRLKIPNASGTRTHHHFSFATTFFFSDLVLSFMLHRLPAHKALQNCSMLQWHFMAMISTCYTYVRRLCFACQVETTSRAYLLLRYTQRMKWSRRRRCHFACGRRPHQKFRSQLKLTHYFAWTSDTL